MTKGNTAPRDRSSGQAEAAREARSGTTVTLRDRYRILLDERLPHLDAPGAQAYAAADTSDPRMRLYALVCSATAQVRHDVLRALRGRLLPNVVSVIAEGGIALNGADKRRKALIMTLPAGGPAWQPGDPSISEDRLLQEFVPQLVAVVDSLAKYDVAHRAIRADNIFYADEDRTHLVVGQCVVGAPGAGQHAAYEPVESTAADLRARGEGTSAYDIYAIGVALVNLLAGKCPLQDADAVTITDLKLAKGTFSAVAPEVGVSSKLGALIAGLLQDDPQRRWSPEKLRNWREGIFDRPQRGYGDRRAATPFPFMDKDYFAPRRLALAIGRLGEASIPHLRDSTLESWVRNSLNDTRMADQLRYLLRALDEMDSTDKKTAAVILARIGMLMDPAGPLWFRQVAVARSGIAAALAAAFAEDDRAMQKTLSELLSSGLLDEGKRDPASLASRPGWLPPHTAVTMAGYMHDARYFGYGLERCLYELNPRHPCLSPLLDGECVDDVRSLMRVLNAKADTLEAGRGPFDRHVAAFIAVHVRSQEKFFAMFKRMKEGDADWLFTVISFFGRLQRLYCDEPLEKFANWAVRSIKPSISRVRSVLRRKFLEAKLEDIARHGDLQMVVDALNLSTLLQKDRQEYEAAVAEYARLTDSADALRNGGDARRELGEEYGHLVSSAVAVTGLLLSAGLSFAVLFT